MGRPELIPDEVLGSGSVEDRYRMAEGEQLVVYDGVYMTEGEAAARRLLNPLYNPPRVIENQMPSLIDPFHRALYAMVTRAIEDRVTDLASGSAAVLKDSSQTVAEKYAAKVAYLMALKDVLAWCEELEADMYGKRKSVDDLETQGSA